MNTEYYKAKSYKSDKAFYTAIVKAIESIKGKGFADDILSIHIRDKTTGEYTAIEQYIKSQGHFCWNQGDKYIYKNDDSSYSENRWYEGIDVEIDSHIYVYLHSEIKPL